MKTSAKAPRAPASTAPKRVSHKEDRPQKQKTKCTKGFSFFVLFLCSYADPCSRLLFLLLCAFGASALFGFPLLLHILAQQKGRALSHFFLSSFLRKNLRKNEKASLSSLISSQHLDLNRWGTNEILINGALTTPCDHHQLFFEAAATSFPAWQRRRESLRRQQKLFFLCIQASAGTLALSPSAL